LLIDSLARDMGVDAHAVSELLALWQRPASADPPANAPELATWRDLLRVQFATATTKILTARQEERLLRIAVDDLELSPAEAREELLAYARQAGFQRVGREEAQRYLTDVLAQKIGDAETIAPDIFQRLSALGQEWGLDSNWVATQIHARLESNVRARRSEAQRTRLLLFGTGGLVCLVLGVFAVRLWLPSRDPQPVVPREASALEPSTAEALPLRVKPPAWWSTELALLVSALRRESSDFESLYAPLAAESAVRRAEAYEVLAGRVIDEARAANERKQWSTLVRQLYREEPDEATLLPLRNAAFAAIEQELGQVPNNAAGYERLFTAVDGWLQSWADAGLPSSRREPLRGLLARLCDCSLTEPTSAEISRASAHFAVRLLSELKDELPRRPEVLTSHYAFLASRAREQAAETFSTVQAELAAAAIRHTPRSYQAFQQLTREALTARGTLPVLTILSAWEACREESLRADLAPQLLARAGLDPSSVPDDQIATRVRIALGVANPADDTSTSAWTRWDERIQPLLERRESSPANLSEQLRETISLAWHVNATVLLAREGASTRWVQLVQAGSPLEEVAQPKPVGAAPERERAERLSSADRQTMERYILELAQFTSLPESKRASYLRGLAKFSEDWPDLTPRQARDLATYLIAPLDEAEAAQRLTMCDRLRKWLTLRLAVGDALAEQREQLPAALPVVIRLAGREPLEPAPNVAVVRRLLTESVLAELRLRGDDTATSPQRAAIDQLDRVLTDLYRQRAGIFKVERTLLESLDGAQALQRAAEKMRPPTLVHDSIDRWERLVTHTGDSRLARMVGMQQLWFERCEAATRKEHPQVAPQLVALLAEHEERQLQATTAVEQLRVGERSLLALWRMWKPSLAPLSVPSAESRGTR
jgi:hypothetical protein